MLAIHYYGPTEQLTYTTINLEQILENSESNY